MEKYKFTLTDSSNIISWANAEEKQNNCISYKHVIEYFFANPLLCNNIADVDPNLFDNIVCGSPDREICQYYLVRADEWTIDHINQLNADNDENIMLAYSDVLDLYVLLVDHCGTAWSYVMTHCPLKSEVKHA